MSLTDIDNYIDNIINNFSEYLIKNDIINKFTKDMNFVKYQNNIIDTIKNFITNLSKEELKNIVNNEDNINYILDIVKRYCAFYIYFGIAYYYKNDRELFVTNIIETSKNQKDSTFQIPNFFNSENNSIIINNYTIIKNVIELNEFKTMDRIKILLGNNPIKYKLIIDFFNELGEDYVEDYLISTNKELNNDTLKNLAKTIILKSLYYKSDRIEVSNFLKEKVMTDGEYKYIDIILGKDEKIVDFYILENLLKNDNINMKNINDYYDYLNDYKEENEFNVLSNKKMLNFLFNNKILIPITEDFLRYHKNNFKYEKRDSSSREDTKIKFILDMINKVKNYNSDIYKKNPKLKLNTKELFSNQFSDKDAILYNYLEEINIISKLKQSTTSTDVDYIIDLDNIRKYSYLNFREFSKDGFRFRSNIPIQGVRYSSIKNKIKKLDLRIGNSDLPLNVVGVIFNPSGRYLEGFSKDDIRDVHNINKNGYNAFLKIMNDKFNTKEKNLYYWLFNTETDNIELNEYNNLSKNQTNRYLEIILSKLYNVYLELLNNKIFNEINNKKHNYYDILKILNNYNKNTISIGINLDFNKILKNKVIDIILNNKEKMIKNNIILNDYIDFKDKNIKIPVSNKIKKKDKIIKIKYELELNEDDQENIIDPICNHYFDWDKLKMISRRNVDELNQAIFDFVKKYVKINDIGLYTCKSCNENLNLKNYVYEGTYVQELDTFMTTSLATNQKLENIQKYNKFTRSIRNIEKILEKICGISNINYYIGNTPVIKLRRRTIIKDVIDLILIHTKYLKTQPKDRIKKAGEIYGINKDLTNLFFFELKDEIFLTSSNETDYYKIIKYNNIIAYLVVIIISELNNGQLLNLKDDKRCNYFIFSKFGINIFENLYLRLNENEKILIKNIPLFCYTIFYFSCILTNSTVWLWDYSNKETNIYSIQKIFIHTVVDLINTLFEANFNKQKDYFYELIVNRIKNKLKNVYNDNNTLESIKDQVKDKIKIDGKSIQFITKKDLLYNVKDFNIDDISTKNYINKCDTETKKLNTIDKYIKTENINILSNCDDGKFHKFSFDNKIKDLVCSHCNKNLNELLKNVDKDNKFNSEKIKLIKLIYLRKLSKKYCKSGKLHDFDENNKCKLCNFILDKSRLTNNELYELNKNINNIDIDEFNTNLRMIRKNTENDISKSKIIKDILNQFNERYVKNTNNKLTNYIDDFVDILKNKIGKNIVLKDETIYLNNNTYIINNNYLGSKLKNEIKFIGDDNIKREYNNFFKKNVIYIKDNNNNVLLYYDEITSIYIGYKKNNDYYKLKSTFNIKIILSIRNILINLGNYNKYHNIYYTNSEYINYSKDDINKEKEYILSNYLRNKISNLKQIIISINSIIEKIKNKSSISDDKIITQQTIIVDQFQKLINNIKTELPDGSKKVFKHLNLITNKINIDTKININNYNIVNNYINVEKFINENNLDAKLIYYIINNFIRLIQYNDKGYMYTMIVKLIHYSFNKFYIPYENINIRRFDKLIINDKPYIDESLRIIGYYQELVEIDNIDRDEIEDMKIDAEEEINSYDIDEYAENDDDDNNEDFDADENIVENIMD